MTEELWTEVCNILQEAVTKTIPDKKKCKKAKWLSEEVLQIAEKRREVKKQRRKGKIEPTECKAPEIFRARNVRRDKQVFLINQCKEIEESNRMGNTRDLFKKIGDSQGNISCKYRHNKGQKHLGPNRSRRV